MPEARSIPAVVKAVECIQGRVQSQARIIDDLLDLSRLNTGKLSLNLARVDWREIIRSICQAVEFEVAAKQIVLTVDLPPGPLWIDADAVRLEEIPFTRDRKRVWESGWLWCVIWSFFMAGRSMRDRREWTKAVF